MDISIRTWQKVKKAVIMAIHCKVIDIMNTKVRVRVSMSACVRFLCVRVRMCVCACACAYVRMCLRDMPELLPNNLDVAKMNYYIASFYRFRIQNGVLKWNISMFIKPSYIFMKN